VALCPSVRLSQAGIAPKEAQLSPRDLCDTPFLHQLKCCLHCTNNAQRSFVSACGPLPAIVSHVFFRYLHVTAFAVGLTIAQWACDAMVVINRLSYNQPCLCQLNHNRDHRTRLPSKLMTTPHIPLPVHHLGHGSQWHIDTDTVTTTINRKWYVVYQTAAIPMTFSNLWWPSRSITYCNPFQMQFFLQLCST